MSDLADFLLARIAEDEADALIFQGTAWAHWRYQPDPDRSRIGGRVVALGDNEIANDWSSPRNPAGYVGVSPHIARWDPVRVLAECEAKTRIVEHHARMADPEGDPGADLCAICSSNGPDAQGWPCDTLRALALPYADHPDYRPEWRP